MFVGKGHKALICWVQIYNPCLNHEVTKMMWEVNYLLGHATGIIKIYNIGEI